MILQVENPKHGQTNGSVRQILRSQDYKAERLLKSNWSSGFFNFSPLKFGMCQRSSIRKRDKCRDILVKGVGGPRLLSSPPSVLEEKCQRHLKPLMRPEGRTEQLVQLNALSSKLSSPNHVNTPHPADGREDAMSLEH